MDEIIKGLEKRVQEFEGRKSAYFKGCLDGYKTTLIWVKRIQADRIAKRKKLINKILEILHWSPVGLITVPIFVFPKSTRSLKWVMLNGPVLLAEYIIIFLLLGI